MAKVLWVIHGAEVYGESRAIFSLMSGVRSSGWQAEAVSLTDGPFYRQLIADGFPMACLHFTRTPGMHLAHTRLGKCGQFFRLIAHQSPVKRRLLAEILVRRPDVIHVLNKNILPAVGAVARALRVPCFWELTAVIGGGFPLHVNRRLYRMLLDRYDLQALANSRFTAQTLPTSRRPAEVMYLGADSAQFDPSRKQTISRADLGIPESAIVFIIVSRIDVAKGQHMFIEAIRQINDPQVHTLLVGDATTEGDRLQVQTIMKSFAPEDAARVHFVGFSSTPEGYIALSDVAVNSRLDPEPFGLSVVEAMMMKKPVLVHALGGTEETVVDGKTGWHIRDSTVEGFVAGIRRALAERESWPVMGARAQERACALFSLEGQTRTYRHFVETRLNLQRSLPNLQA